MDYIDEEEDWEIEIYYKEKNAKIQALIVNEIERIIKENNADWKTDKENRIIIHIINQDGNLFLGNFPILYDYSAILDSIKEINNKSRLQSNKKLFKVLFIIDSEDVETLDFDINVDLCND